MAQLWSRSQPTPPYCKDAKRASERVKSKVQLVGGKEESFPSKCFFLVREGKKLLSESEESAKVFFLRLELETEWRKLLGNSFLVPSFQFSLFMTISRLSYFISELVSYFLVFFFRHNDHFLSLLQSF